MKSALLDTLATGMSFRTWMATVLLHGGKQWCPRGDQTILQSPKATFWYDIQE